MGRAMRMRQPACGNLDLWQRLRAAVDHRVGPLDIVWVRSHWQGLFDGRFPIVHILVNAIANRLADVGAVDCRSDAGF
eukprot:11200419-Lingulodinium_polyedra.AAC.1